MRPTLFTAIICIGSAAIAQPVRVTSASDQVWQGTQERDQRQAMRERMGQLQLDLLVDSIVRTGEQARNDTRAADKAVASNER